MDRLRSNPVDQFFVDLDDAAPHYPLHHTHVLRFHGAPPTRERLAAHLASRLHLVPELGFRPGSPHGHWERSADAGLEAHLRIVRLGGGGHFGTRVGRQLGARVGAQIGAPAGTRPGAYATTAASAPATTPAGSAAGPRPALPGTRAHLGTLPPPPAGPAPRTPDPVGADPEAGFARAVQALLEASLSPLGPVWDIWLLEGWAPGEFAIAYRSHHAFQDAGAAGETTRRLFGPPDAEPVRAPRARPGRLAVLAHVPRVVADLVTTRTRTRGSFVPPAGGHGTRVAVSEPVDLDQLRAIGEAHGASVNQVYLAGLCGALAGVFEERDPYVCVPMSTARPGDGLSGLGNRLSMLRVELPCAEPSPQRRMELILRRTASARTPERRACTSAMIGLCPDALARWTVRNYLQPRRTQLVASNRALPGGLSFDGIAAHTALFVPPLIPGHRGFCFFSTFERKARLAVVFPAGSANWPAVPERWLESLEELATLG
ncbi:wax ester/triacylglycerol synthase domain-containing protein [Streptomyces polygonati]|uniref:Wax ester/triacylglycerol synthase domain-containing protein n=1 Tax=Streptomyces polygonati TaxID=1617087 RepID=A0ABV8I1N2_9ACTN